MAPNTIVANRANKLNDINVQVSLCSFSGGRKLVVLTVSTGAVVVFCMISLREGFAFRNDHSAALTFLSEILLVLTISSNESDVPDDLPKKAVAASSSFFIDVLSLDPDSSAIIWSSRSALLPECCRSVFNFSIRKLVDKANGVARRGKRNFPSDNIKTEQIVTRINTIVSNFCNTLYIQQYNSLCIWATIDNGIFTSDRVRCWTVDFHS